MHVICKMYNDPYSGPSPMAFGSWMQVFWQPYSLHGFISFSWGIVSYSSTNNWGYLMNIFMYWHDLTVTWCGIAIKLYIAIWLLHAKLSIWSHKGYCYIYSGNFQVTIACLENRIEPAALVFHGPIVHGSHSIATHNNHDTLWTYCTAVDYKLITS